MGNFRSQQRLWAAELPELQPFGSRFLLGRLGPLLLGVCLDGTGDPRRYQPTGLVHNLLRRFDVVTLAYGWEPGRELRRTRFVIGRSEADIAPVCEHLRRALAIDGFAQVVDRMRACRVRQFVPHVVFDVATVGAACGVFRDRDALWRWCVDGTEDLQGTNWRACGGRDAWLEQLERTLAEVFAGGGAALAEANARHLGLPELAVAELRAGAVDLDELGWVFG